MMNLIGGGQPPDLVRGSMADVSVCSWDCIQFRSGMVYGKALRVSSPRALGEVQGYVLRMERNSRCEVLSCVQRVDDGAARRRYLSSQPTTPRREVESNQERKSNP